jgi:hypothetical protein
MLRTCDAAKIGRTVYLATAAIDDGDWAYAIELGTAELPNVGLAKGWLGRRLNRADVPAEGVYGNRPFAWGRIERGTYYRDTFCDHDTGELVEDGDLRLDESWRLFAYRQADGQVTWEEDSG